MYTLWEGTGSLVITTKARIRRESRRFGARGTYRLEEGDVKPRDRK